MQAKTCMGSFHESVSQSHASQQTCPSKCIQARDHALCTAIQTRVNMPSRQHKKPDTSKRCTVSRVAIVTTDKLCSVADHLAVGATWRPFTLGGTLARCQMYDHLPVWNAVSVTTTMQAAQWNSSTISDICHGRWAQSP